MKYRSLYCLVSLLSLTCSISSASAQESNVPREKSKIDWSKLSVDAAREEQIPGMASESANEVAVRAPSTLPTQQQQQPGWTDWLLGHAPHATIGAGFTVASVYLIHRFRATASNSIHPHTFEPMDLFWRIARAAQHAGIAVNPDGTFPALQDLEPAIQVEFLAELRRLATK